jgi:hypothetical protein
MFAKSIAVAALLVGIVAAQSNYSIDIGAISLTLRGESIWVRAELMRD